VVHHLESEDILGLLEMVVEQFGADEVVVAVLLVAVVVEALVVVH
jgi:hypothetical protein